MVSKLLKLYLFAVFFTLGTMNLYGSYSEINFSSPLLRKGLKHCLLGDKAEIIIGKPFKPSLVPGPNGEELIMKSITDRRFGFDSLHLGFTMESQQLCSLGFCRNFDYSTSDQEIYNVLTNVFEWVNATFQGSIERNKTFDLRTPSQSLYANVDTEMLELKIEASKRNDVPMAWVMISMKDKQLIHEASIEFDRVSNSPTIKADVKKRKDVASLFAPLIFAIPLYIICCMPLFLVFVVIYIIIIKMQKKKICHILHWTDPCALLLAPYTWAFFEHIGQPKTLSNIFEFAIIGWIWCGCLAARYILIIINRITYWRYYGYATFLIVIIFSIMMSICFPTLPE
jgi:hypothetical protein